jgi:hypothetical protein
MALFIWLLEALEHAPGCALNERERADRCGLAVDSHREGHLLSCDDAGVSGGMLIGHFPDVHRATVLSHECTRNVKSSVAISHDRLVEGAVRAVELSNRIRLTDRQLNVIAPPSAEQGRRS